MKKFMSYLLMFCFVFIASLVPMNALTDAIACEATSGVLSDDCIVSPSNEKFMLACSVSEMLYGSPTASYNGRTYGFSSGKLCSVDMAQKKDVKTILDCDGDNINQIGSVVYFTTDSEIVSYNLDTKQIKKILSVNTGRIKYLYVVNSSEIYFLSGEDVYHCDMNGNDLRMINPIKGINSFSPTNSGILYEVDSGKNNSLYLDDVCILPNESYYSIIDNYLIATVNEQLLQIPFSTLRSLVFSAVSNSIKYTDVSSYMSPFDLLGVYDVCDVLGLNDETHGCNYCESIENEIDAFSFDYRHESVEERAVVTDTYINYAGDMIVNRASDLMYCAWTPLKTLRSYPHDDTYTTFTKNEKVIGVPYSRGKLFGDDCEFTQLPITFSGNKGITLNEFRNNVANSSSDLYKAATKYPDSGPLYGCDCSAFVSYCWEIGRITTAGFSSSAKCSALESNVSVLQVGDALVKSNNHCILIREITSSNITVWEQTPPMVTETTYTTGNFKTKYLDKGYVPYRLNRVKLSLNCNGGSCSYLCVYAASGMQLGTSVNLPTPTRTGFTFSGWYTSASGGERVTSTKTFSSNTTLYAHWADVYVADDIDFIIIDPLYLNRDKNNYLYF